MSSSPPHESLFFSFSSPTFQPLATYLTSHSPPREPSPTPLPTRQGPISFGPPQLFRDIFSSMPEPVPRRQAVLPNPPEYPSHETFAGAIQRASRAVANAEEAFHPRGSHNAPIIDLTGSPPNESSEVGRRRHSRTQGGVEADFISTTTHPHDTSTRPQHRSHLASLLNDPVYGFVAPPSHSHNRIPTVASDSLERARRRRAQAFQANARRIPHGNIHRRPTAREEQDAVRRQHQNRITWEQTQARLRQFQQTLRDQEEPEVSVSSAITSPEPVSELSSGQVTPQSAMSSKENIESIDLTAVEDSSEVAKVLSKQRSEAIISQRPAGATDEGRTVFTAFKCPICMESLKRATVTKCGHIFCHKCVVDTLKWSSEQHRQEHPTRKAHPGTCPVCRATLAIKDTKGPARTLVPLHMKIFTRNMIRDVKGKRRADSIDAAETPTHKKRKHAKGRRTKMPPGQKRESTEDLFGEFTNEDLESGFIL